MASETFLESQFDARGSFYRKAKVETEDSNNKKLYSYGTLVAEIKDGEPIVYDTYSNTTVRHIKEFLLQNGFKADNKNQIVRDYSEKKEESKEIKTESSIQGDIADEVGKELEQRKSELLISGYEVRDIIAKIMADNDYHIDNIIYMFKEANIEKDVQKYLEKDYGWRYDMNIDQYRYMDKETNNNKEKKTEGIDEGFESIAEKVAQEMEFMCDTNEVSEIVEFDKYEQVLYDVADLFGYSVEEVEDSDLDSYVRGRLSQNYGWETDYQTGDLKREDEELQESKERKTESDSRADVKRLVTNEAERHFRQMKEIIEDGEDKEELDGIFYPHQAIEILERVNMDFHLNPYMDLTISDVLDMIRDNDSIDGAIDELYDEYKDESARSWAENFITVLDKVDVTKNRVKYFEIGLDVDGEIEYHFLRLDDYVSPNATDREIALWAVRRGDLDEVDLDNVEFVNEIDEEEYNLSRQDLFDESKLIENIKYEYFDRDDLDNLGSDAELIDALYGELGMIIDESWDNVLEDMENEKLKMANVNGKMYIVYDDGKVKGYVTGRDNNNEPIVIKGEIK